jgi:hypothetical protein
MVGFEGDEFLVEGFEFGVFRGFGETAVKTGNAIFGGAGDCECHLAGGAADLELADCEEGWHFRGGTSMKSEISSSLTAQGRML